MNNHHHPIHTCIILLLLLPSFYSSSLSSSTSSSFPYSYDKHEHDISSSSSSSSTTSNHGRITTTTTTTAANEHRSSTEVTCPNLVWSDEFNGNALDTNRWRYRHGDGCQYGWWMCGWGNKELEYYTTDSVVVSDGILSINVAQSYWEDGNVRFTSGRIESRNEVFPLPIYGRFEARMKIPFDDGIWPALWMLPVNNTYGPWPRSGELDIMENIGYKPKTMSSCVHWGNGLGKKHIYEDKSFVLSDGTLLNETFHVFAMEKEENLVRFMVDDAVFFTRTIDDLKENNVWPFNQEFRFIVNIAIGHPITPKLNDFPTSMQVDYVRVYDRPTPSMTGIRSLNLFSKRYAVFKILNAPEDAKFVWEVSDGAQITSSPDGSEIEVNFGLKSFGALSVSCRVESLCGSKTIRNHVHINALGELLIVVMLAVLVYVAFLPFFVAKRSRLKRSKDSSSKLANNLHCVEFKERRPLLESTRSFRKNRL